jgi:hypothetical protein
MIPDHRFRIAFLQSEYDPFPAAAAKPVIEGIFGPNCLSGGSGFWRIIPGEPHTPRSIRAKALVAAAILQLLATPTAL